MWVELLSGLQKHMTGASCGRLKAGCSKDLHRAVIDATLRLNPVLLRLQPHGGQLSEQLLGPALSCDHTGQGCIDSSVVVNMSAYTGTP